MGVAIGAPKRKRTRRTPEQAEVPADGGLMEMEEEATSMFKINVVTNPDLPEPKCVVLAGPHGVGQVKWKPLNEVKPEPITDVLREMLDKACAKMEPKK